LDISLARLNKSDNRPSPNWLTVLSASPLTITSYKEKQAT
jgi:hypothetical protein